MSWSSRAPRPQLLLPGGLPAVTFAAAPEENVFHAGTLRMLCTWRGASSAPETTRTRSGAPTASGSMYPAPFVPVGGLSEMLEPSGPSDEPPVMIRRSIAGTARSCSSRDGRAGVVLFAGQVLNIVLRSVI
ncbi:hypothetical protein GUJ93_ZPchr0001g32057 [Zizania palustris]|uniref:Uncharacterized protein n=1 Tax=Zizania palustris TaxID=103762 RepID=A0A8J5VPE8_ZIZPA|nr:hypothetical protein GUJ93_ZPchr0001g32057 [Zizania palustris]